jgi:hypothetical protein
MGTTSSSPVVLGAIPRIPDEIVAETYFRFMPGELRTEVISQKNLLTELFTFHLPLLPLSP